MGIPGKRLVHLRRLGVVHKVEGSYCREVEMLVVTPRHVFGLGRPPYAVPDNVWIRSALLRHLEIGFTVRG